MRDPAAVPSEAEGFRLATGYLARRAASKLQLRRYLLRKLGRADTQADAAPVVAEVMVEAVLARLERLGLIDEARLAESRARTLAGKGYSGRRLRRHLAHQGFDVADPVLAPSLEVDDEAQALRYAERKRLGPFASGRRTGSVERDVRALVRAGFAVDVAWRVLRQGRPDGGDDPAGRPSELNEP